MTTNDTEGLRNFLRDLIVYGDEKGWVEYTDAGVWITDKGISAAQALFTQRLREAETAAIQQFANQLLQYNGAYIGIDGKRVDNMVHHDVIRQLSTDKGEE